MASGLRKTRRIFGVFVIVGLAYVGWVLWRLERPRVIEVEEAATAPSGIQPAQDPTAQSGCAEPSVVDWPGGPFRRLEAAKACMFADGSSELHQVVLHVRDDAAGAGDDATMIITADQGTLPVDEGAPVLLRGNVTARRGDGFSLAVDHAQLRRADTRMVCDSPVRITFGDVVGSAGALDHDWTTKESLLTSEPVLRVAGQRMQGRDVTVRGSSIRIAQEKRRVLVQQEGSIDMQGGQITGDTLDIRLSSTSDDVEEIASTGNAETVTTAAVASQGPAMARRLRASRILHAFTTGTHLTSVEGAGGAVLSGASAPASPGSTAATEARSEVLSGDSVRLRFGGGAVMRLDGIEARSAAPAISRLVVAQGASRRQVACEALSARIGATGTVERFVATGGVAMQEAAPGVARTLSAERVEAGFAGGGDGRLETLAFEGAPAHLTSRIRGADGKDDERTMKAATGSVRLGERGEPVSGRLRGGVEVRGGGGNATGDEATIDEATGQHVLTGHASVESEGKTSHGDEVIHDPKQRTLTVRGNQHTVVAARANVAAMGGLASGDEPTYISADQVVVRLDGREAVYTGGRPSLRRGDNEIQADTLTLDDIDGTLDAEGDVDSRLRLAEPRAAKAAAPPGMLDPTRLIFGRCDVLRFRRAENVVSYLGHATLTQEDSELRADTVDVHLLEEGRKVRSVASRGAAFFHGPAGEAEGDEILYEAQTGLLRVVGGARPARAMDAEGGFGRGGIVEMTLGTSGVRVVAPATGRTRGASALTQGAQP